MLRLSFLLLMRDFRKLCLLALHLLIQTKNAAVVGNHHSTTYSNFIASVSQSLAERESVGFIKRNSIERFITFVRCWRQRPSKLPINRNPPVLPIKDTDRSLMAMNQFGDFDNEDFANFDLEAAVDSAKTRKRKQLNVNPGKKQKLTFGFKPAPSRKFSSDNANPSLSAAEGEKWDLLSDEFSIIPSHFQKSITCSLKKYFGHSGFRPGQLDILFSLLGNEMNHESNNNSHHVINSHDQPRDACVFWATGAGKSLCYQLPPLHLNQVALVISPLISLMQDQCAKLNGNMVGSGDNNGRHDNLGSGVATFLGSSQNDPQAESRAVKGEYRLVYLTPEKLLGDKEFLERLARMHKAGGKGRICLIAVDESHCVSEWGHDFRPEFLNIGPKIRSHPILSTIPLLALSATAVPHVQQDIMRNLCMNPNAVVAKRSFDRPNLKIAVRRKPSNGATGVFDPIVEEIAKSIVERTNSEMIGAKVKGMLPGKSTIVYVSSKKEAEDITSIIVKGLARQITRLQLSALISLEQATDVAASLVRSYHAGLSNERRTQVHTEFLIGKVVVIVATVAFGMGIDKPDIRRVIHWGACKSLEEYYQQIGRAGRDGLNAECTMYCNTSDFAKYHGDFYLRNLNAETRKATMSSMAALKNFALDTEGCRRATLLEFFEEIPSFGKFCGTCDLCSERKNYGDDIERDFRSEGALVVLFAIRACPYQAMTTIETVVKGGSVETYKYYQSHEKKINEINRRIDDMKRKMTKKQPITYFKDLIPPLVNRGYVEQRTKTSSHKHSRPYFVYGLTPKGNEALFDDAPVILPVPASIREVEKLQEERKEKELLRLRSAGVDLEQIPQEELDKGDGEAISALKRWFSYIDSLKMKGHAEKVSQLDDLKSRIVAWRLDMAERYRMAPASVMGEHLLVKIAYAAASLRNGCRMERDALLAAGVRSNGIDELMTALGEWTDTNAQCLSDINATTGQMSLAAGVTFKPASSWKYSVYKPNRKTGLAAWELSYKRFTAGEHPQTIAMTQANGKPIQVTTVVGHIFDALLDGHPVDLYRLSQVNQAPNKHEWEELCRCELETGMDAVGNPMTSGADGDRFLMKDFLLPILGKTLVLKERTERNAEERATFSKWCERLKWYLNLRRTGFEPTFNGD